MVQIFKKTDQLSDQIRKAREKGKRIGFVPTMGALHEGHLNLIRKARKENALLVVSIYVNPTQFDDPDDYRNYPRTRDQDIEKLKAHDCDILFMPGDQEMYPEGPEQLHGFDPGFLGRVLEGRFRPGHFQGVATIVKKLFDVVQPDRAYFGQKDYQQLLIIKKLVRDFSFAINIVPVPITREPDGLAISSRNVLLTTEQRTAAPVIYQTLQWAREKLLNAYSVTFIKEEAFRKLEKQKLIDNVEYFEIRDALTFYPINEKGNGNENVVICTALSMGKIRLIDNLLIQKGT